MLLCLSAAAPSGEIDGVVRGSAGEPVAGAAVMLDGVGGPAVLSTETDPAGRFRLAPVAPGSYSLEVRAAGYAPLRLPLALAGPVARLTLTLEAPGGDRYHTTIRSGGAPLPSREPTSTSAVGRAEIEALPGGTTLPLNQIAATQPGVTPDEYGAIHVRGNFEGLQLRIDGIPLPPGLQDRLQQLLESQLVEELHVTVGGVPAEIGEQVAGVLAAELRRPAGPPSGEAELSYGSYGNTIVQANMGGGAGGLSILGSASFQSTGRGLDAPAPTPILHDGLLDGRGLLKVDDRLGARDDLELLALYGESHYQIPIDPTELPLSQLPQGRQPDGYGNTPPPFVPYDANPTELERDGFAALAWRHDFTPRARFEVQPFFRYEASDLACDTAGQLGPTADPGATCSTVDHRVLQGGAQVDETLGLGPNDLKAGALADFRHSSATYSQFFRNDASPAGGAAPGRTISGEDILDALFAGVYAQDTLRLRRWTIELGLRLDAQQAALAGTAETALLWGPSVRLGASYAVSEAVVLHGYAGQLWQPPSFDAVTAARVLGLVPAGAAVPLDLQGETDWVAELGVSARVLPQLTLTVTPWGRLAKDVLDDQEVGDTALTADYNYRRGRALGADASALLAVRRYLHAFANVTVEVAQGQGIATATYLFTPQQLASTGWQALDNAQLVSGNAGADWSVDGGATHLAGLVTFGSGLRTGPTNGATLPPYWTLDLTLRHRFERPLPFELAFDAKNLFGEVVAYRIATGSLAGSAYGPLSEVDARLTVFYGG
ncbi:MAG: TonB-dependent receptor [Myxococcales bacterium]